MIAVIASLGDGRPAFGQLLDRQFPGGATVNVALPPFSADLADNGNDDTTALENAIRYNIGSNSKIIYLPNGVYNVNRQISVTDPGGNWGSNFTLQGQSRDGVIIKLRNNTFTNPNAPQSLFRTGSEGAGSDGSGNNAFSHNIFDVTINTGSGNTGAIGIDYLANNQGSLKNVKIVSGDGQGVAGISMRRQWPGPCLLKNVAVQGFDYAVDIGDAQFSVTAEDLTISGQRVAGVRNEANVFSVRRLTSVNTVPALIDASVNAHTVILDSTLSGGSSVNYAVNIQGNLLARSVTTSGYKTAAIRSRGSDITGPNYTEFVSQPVKKTSFSSPLQTLNLTVEETPNDYWNNDPSQWAWVTGNGAIADDGNDDSDGFQSAIDSGSPIIFIPPGTYHFYKTVYVRGNVRLILGGQGVIETNWRDDSSNIFRDGANPKPLFRLENVNSGQIQFRGLRFNAQWPGALAFESNTSNTVVFKQVFGFCDGGAYRNVNTTGGKVFLEDVSFSRRQQEKWYFKNQNVWARQLNPECNGDDRADVVQITNDGGRLWVLGLKTEGLAPFIETKNGGRTEILGAFHLLSERTQAIPTSIVPYIVGNNSALSMSGVFVNYSPAISNLGETNGDYRNFFKETRGGTIRYLSRSGTYTRNGGASDWSRVLPLFVANPF